MITGFVTRVTRWVSLVEQELRTLSEHLSSHLVFSGVRVTQSLVFCIMFRRSLFVLLFFFFWPLCCLSILRFTSSDYPVVIFKLFLKSKKWRSVHQHSLRVIDRHQLNSYNMYNNHMLFICKFNPNGMISLLFDKIKCLNRIFLWVLYMTNHIIVHIGSLEMVFFGFPPPI